MQNTNDIGLIVWGCKGGHRVFCCSRWLDCNEKSIKDTIKDIRSFVRFSRINLTAYALEFTDKYKVYTIYRSCNDNGSGAYVAITIYVPHGLQVQNLRSALDEVMDIYFKEFIHPVFGTYLDGKYDDIEQYTSFLKNLSVAPEKERYEYTLSVQNDVPRLLVYDEVISVDKFFSSPYRKEFFDCQEVFFLGQSLYDKRPETLEFNNPTSVNIIDLLHVSEPERLPQLDVSDIDVERLKLNGTLVDKDRSWPVNVATDSVEIVLYKKYCEKSVISGFIFELLRTQKLKQDKSTKRISLGVVQYTYKKYSIRFQVNGANVPAGLLFIKDCYNSVRKSYDPVEDSAYVFDGQYLGREHELYLMPYRENNDKLIKIKSFRPIDFLENVVSISLSTFDFTVKFDKNISDKRFYMQNIPGLLKKDLEIKVLKDTVGVTVYLPEDTDLSAIAFDVVDNETTSSFDFDNKILTLTSKVMEYELIIPKDVSDSIGKVSWDFKIAGKSKKAYSFQKNKVKIDADDCINDGKLEIDGITFDYDVIEYKIYPQIVLIKIPSGITNLRFKPLWGKGIEKTVDKNSIFSYKKEDIRKVGISVSSPYCSSIPKLELGLYTINITKDYSDTPSYGCKKSVTSGVNNDYGLIFRNCKGFSFDQTRITNDPSNRIPFPKNNLVTLCNTKGKPICIIRRNENEYSSDEIKNNNKRGFKITYNDEQCIVEYKKPSSIFVRLLDKKWFLPLVIVLLLVVIVGGVYAVFVRKHSPEIVVCKICFEVNKKNYDFGEKVTGIQLAESNPLLQIDKDTVFIIWNEDSARTDSYQNLMRQYLSVYVDNVECDPITLGSRERDIRKCLSSVNDAGNYKSKVFSEYIQSKLQKDLSSAEVQVSQNGMSDSLKMCEYKKVVDHYGKNRDSVISYALEKAARFAKEKATMQTYLKMFEDYKGNNTYKSVLHTSQRLENESKNYEQMLTAAKDYKKLLHDIRCKLDDVNRVADWWKKISENDKKNCGKIGILDTSLIMQ